jgi:hypothetical protein
MILGAQELKSAVASYITGGYIDFCAQIQNGGHY